MKELWKWECSCMRPCVSALQYLGNEYLHFVNMHYSYSTVSNLHFQLKFLNIGFLNMIKSTFVVSQIQVITQGSFSLKLLHD